MRPLLIFVINIRTDLLLNTQVLCEVTSKRCMEW